MKHFLAFIILFSFFVCFPTLCLAFSRAPFLIEGARPLSMGRAFVAVSDGENAFFYNPAGIGLNDKVVLYIDNISQYKSWDYPSSELYSYLDIQILAGFVNKNLGVGAAIRTKNFSYTDYISDCRYDEVEVIPILTLGMKLNRWFSWGIRGKFNIFSNFLGNGNYDVGNIVSLDGGILYKPIEILALGLMCENLLSTRGYYFIGDDGFESCEAKDLPQNLHIGLSLKLPSDILLAFDVHNLLESSIVTFWFGGQEIRSPSAPCIPYQFKRSYHVGAEIPVSNLLTIRIGGFSERYPHSFFSVVDDSYLYQNSYMVTIGGEFNLNNLKLNMTLAREFKEEQPSHYVESPLNDWYFSLSGSWIF